MRRWAFRLALWLVVGCTPTTSTTPPAEPSPPGEDAAATAPASEHDAPPLTAATDLYQATYGDAGRTLVFLHGGPGYNSALFEASTADALAADYRVVVYDRRGAGRSPDVTDGTASFTFAQTSVDLEAILAGTPAPILLAHSFGGAVAVAYLDSHPEFDGQVVLINAPVSYPRSLHTIVDNCRDVYDTTGNDESLRQLERLSEMDDTTAMYASFVFMHGMSCGLYRPSRPTEEAGKIFTAAAKKEASKFFTVSKPLPVSGFVDNEHYTTLDLSPKIEAHADRIWAIYSDEDRIISPDDRAFLKKTLGERYVQIEGAAHNVFIDQQAAFITALGRLVAATGP